MGGTASTKKSSKGKSPVARVNDHPDRRRGIVILDSSEENPVTVLMKLLVIGGMIGWTTIYLLLVDSGVGKTSFLLRFGENLFREEEPGGIPPGEFKIRTLQINNHPAKIQLFDTPAGIERFRYNKHRFKLNQLTCEVLHEFILPRSL